MARNLVRIELALLVCLRGALLCRAGRLVRIVSSFFLGSDGILYPFSILPLIPLVKDADCCSCVFTRQPKARSFVVGSIIFVIDRRRASLTFLRPDSHAHFHFYSKLEPFFCTWFARCTMVYVPV